MSDKKGCCPFCGQDIPRDKEYELRRNRQPSEKDKEIIEMLEAAVAQRH